MQVPGNNKPEQENAKTEIIVNPGYHCKLLATVTIVSTERGERDLRNDLNCFQMKSKKTKGI